MFIEVRPHPAGDGRYIVSHDGGGLRFFPNAHSAHHYADGLMDGFNAARSSLPVARVTRVADGVTEDRDEAIAADDEAMEAEAAR